MNEFVFTPEELNIDSPLGWTDETLGKLALHNAMILAENRNSAGYDIHIGLEQAPVILGAVVRKAFNNQPMGFNIQVRGKKGEIITYCVAIQKQINKIADEETLFSALVDGERIRSDDGEEIIERIRAGEKLTEFTIQLRKDK